MLISHSYKFIFTKTFKTAGTSVERYFEPYCVDAESRQADDEERVGLNGIVGKRGGRGNAIWYSHMPAQAIRELLGEQKWKAYYKFTIVRNPFDQLISAYFFMLHQKLEKGLIQRTKPFLKTLLKGKGAVYPGSETDHVINFRKWISNGAYFDDSSAYIIDSKLCMDFVMRYENLSNDLETVCKRLGIPFEIERLGKHKSQFRPEGFAISKMYDDATIELVNKRYRGVLDRFQYEFPKL